jgi:hypothetical protein
MVEGSRIEWTNLTGGSPVLQSTYSLFRNVYDSVNLRFIVFMQYEASGAVVNGIDIAVSKDSKPNDGWYFSSLNTSLTINGQLTASDRSTLTVDGSNIYVTTEQDNVKVSGSPGMETWVISDSSLYNGGTPTVVASQILPASQGRVQSQRRNRDRRRRCQPVGCDQLQSGRHPADRYRRAIAALSLIGSTG